MDKTKVEVVKRYYFRKDGVDDVQGYDWIGKICEVGLYPVELNGKLGFADCNGQIVVPIIYDRYGHCNDTIPCHSDMYLDLRKNGLKGLVKKDGTIAVEFEWHDMWLWKLSEDMVPVALNDKWGFVNVKTGKVQVQPSYDSVECFNDGFAPVCIDGKWGIVDKKGEMIIEPKYLLDFYFYHDFAIVFEGGSWSWKGKGRVVSDSNCKIVNKKGYEIISDCSWIDRVGVNTFAITREIDGKSVESIKQFVSFPNYIVVIDDAEYVEGYITAQGDYYKDLTPDIYGSGAEYFRCAKYLRGGTLSAIDYTGKSIAIPKSKLQKVKHSLLSVK